MIRELKEAFVKEKNSIREILKRGYEQYISEVSPRDMAISLETSTFLYALCDFTNPKYVLDLGSGFSSYTFRKFKSYNKNTVVYSVDTSDQWLEKSKEFCKKQNLNIWNFKLWSEIIGIEKKFDLVFFDIDYTVNRHKYLRPTIDRFMNKSSIIVFDDFHKPGIRTLAKNVFGSFYHKFYDLREITLDSGGRNVRYNVMYTDIDIKR